MAKSREAARVPCQIYLVIDGGDAAMARLSAALDAVTVASVLIRPGQLDAAGVKQLVEFCQERDIATLIANDPSLARTLRADGVHLDWSATLQARFDEAREILGNRYMIGAEIAPDADSTKHDAMELAEAGADYIGFGPGAGQAELLSWWASIFEIPCVAFGVDTVEAAAACASTGAEFVAVQLGNGSSPADSAALVASVASAIAAAPTRTSAEP